MSEQEPTPTTPPVAVTVDRRMRPWTNQGPRDRRVIDLPFIGPERRSGRLWRDARASD